MSKIKMEKRNSKGEMNYAVIDLSSLKTYESFGWTRSTTQINPIKPTAERVIVKPAEVAKDIEEVKAKKEEPKIHTLPEDYEFLKLKEMKDLEFVKFHFTAEEIAKWKTKAKAVESINLKK
jgi:hypothetical protein